MITFPVFYFEMSGKENSDSQSENTLLILIILFVFHKDILGKENKDSQLENI